MGTTSDKLTYLNTTKGKIKDVINMTGANITSDTTFRNYATKLYDGYIGVLKDKNTLLDNMPKGTSTGTITDAADLSVYEDKMSKLSTQDGTPSPSNPVDVNTVKGYRNLFESGAYATLGSSSYFAAINGTIINSPYTTSSSYRGIGYVAKVKAGKTYTFSTDATNVNDYLIVGVYQNISDITDGSKILERISQQGNYTFTPSYDGYAIVGKVATNSNTQISWTYAQLVEGTEELPYVPYGTNWIYTAISNGTDTNYYTIPLNGNEIAGIGDYKDELMVDRNGHCWLNKKFPKKIFTENDNWVRQSVYTNNTRYVLNDSNVVAIPGTTILSNYFLKGVGGSDTTNIAINGGNGWLMITIPNTIAPTLVDFKNWLQTKYNEDNPVYALYVTTTPQLIDLNYTVDLTLFEGINNISNSDDMDMEIKYIKDTYE